MARCSRSPRPVSASVRCLQFSRNKLSEIPDTSEHARAVTTCQASEFPVIVARVAVEKASLAVVVGRNCKRLRTYIGVTQDELARHARTLGLTSWKASAVGDFEAGRSTPSFSTVLTVTAALQWSIEDRAEQAGMTGKDLRASKLPGVTLADLLEFDGMVTLTDTFWVFGSELAEMCRKGYVFTLDPSIYSRDSPEPFNFGPGRLRKFEIRSGAYLREREDELGITFDELTSMLQRSGLAEQRLARQLEVKPAELAAASFRLWKRTFTEERDRRAGTEANQQKKGRISREMRAELEGELAHGHD